MRYRARKLKGSWDTLDAARLGISLGQPYHEGEKLEALCAWTAARFASVEVMVADTLNRWNDMAVGQPVQDWRKIGDAWLDRNAAALNQLPGLRVTRWDDYRADPDYPARRRRVEERYDSGGEFAREIDEMAEAFRLKRGWATSARGPIRSYLLEEAAVWLLMARRPAADIYPGSMMQLDRFFDVRLYPVRVDFRRVAPAPDLVA